MAKKFPTLTGVNIAGAEWEWSSSITPKQGTNYEFISNQDADYIVSKGFNFTRFLYAWELMQPSLNGALSTSGYAGVFKTRVDYMTSKGLYVLVEPHGASSPNFVRYKGNLVGTTAVPNNAFADLWSKMATMFKDNPRVIFGLSNEPNNIGTAQWFTAAQAAITAIRATGATNFIMVNGNGWSQPASWNDTWYDTSSGTKVSNATGWSSLNDPLKNTIVSVHTYFDADGGGFGSGIVSKDIIVQRLKPVVDWARSKGLKVHLSEFGAGLTETGAQEAVSTTCNYITANSDVLIGWSWWTYGPPSWWGGYKFTLCPKNNYATDDAKIAWLKPHMAPLQNPADFVDSPTPPNPSTSFPTNPVSFTKGAAFTLNTSLSNYWVFVPNSYDSTHKTPTQMFVWLHGCGGKSQYDISMVSPGGSQNWISVAVGGREGECWSNVATDGPKILAAIADMKTHFNIDPKKVALGGYSSGGDIGYPLMFQNASLFSGGLFENTGPSSSAMSDSTKASWKLNIAHLAHTSDTTYPIAGVRSSLTTLKNNGFPATLIEKPGTHWDNDLGTTGTSYDLRTFLLPYLNAGWVSGGTVVPPAPSLNIVKTSTTAKAPGDQGKNFEKVVAAGQSVPAGTYTLKTAIRTSYSDQNSFSVNVFFQNDHTNVDFVWEELHLDLRGHTIESIWNATIAGTDEKGFTIVKPTNETKIVYSQGKNSFGFYLKRATATEAKAYQVLAKTIKW